VAGQVYNWEAFFPTLTRGGQESQASFTARQERRLSLIGSMQVLRRRVSLVLPHKITRQQVENPERVVTYTQQVTLYPPRRGFDSTYLRRSGGERGVVTEFSRESRCRLLRHAARLDLEFRAKYFITLTWDGWRDKIDREEVCRARRAFLARLDRRKDIAGYLWRLEYQKRGAAHFHLLVWGQAGLAPMDSAWMAPAWHAVTKSEQFAHLVYGVNVQDVGEHGKLVAYVAKYAAKSGTVPEWHRGRLWGCRGEQPTEGLVLSLPKGVPELVRRVALQWLGKEWAGVGNFSERGKSASVVGGAASGEGGGVTPGWQEDLEGVEHGTVHLNFMAGRVVSWVLREWAKVNNFERQVRGQCGAIVLRDLFGNPRLSLGELEREGIEACAGVFL
jgi:hypothetical protein